MSEMFDDKDKQIQKLQMLLDATSAELVRSQEFYIKNMLKVRFYLKCLLSELGHLPVHKRYSNHMYKISLQDIIKESEKRG
jgi:hypothetical protein